MQIPQLCRGCFTATTYKICQTCRSLSSGKIIICKCSSKYVYKYRASYCEESDCIQCILKGFYPIQTEIQKEAILKLRICPGICGFYQSIYKTYCEDCICMMQYNVSFVNIFIDKFGGVDKIQSTWSYLMGKTVDELFKKYMRTFLQQIPYHDKYRKYQYQKMKYEKHKIEQKKQEQKKQEQDYQEQQENKWQQQKQEYLENKKKKKYEVESETFNFTLDTALYVFNLSSFFDARELKKKYISLCLQYHPDKFQVHLHDIEICNKKMKEFNVMYNLLLAHIS